MSEAMQGSSMPTLVEPTSNPAALILDPRTYQSMSQLATLMAKGKASIPAHLRGNEADCMAVVLQSMAWQMNPFAVAQKTFIVNGGQLSYEAQLVNAVITSKAPITGRLEYEWFGPWENILGKMREVTSRTKKDEDTGEPKKYLVPGWTFEDEKGIGVKIWATFKGETKPRILELLLSQVRTRKSTQWGEDPKQQIAYLVTKKWARLFCPDVILGVYTPDEFDSDGDSVREVDITPTADGEDRNPAIDPAVELERQLKRNDEETITNFRKLYAIAKARDMAGYEAAWKELDPKQRMAIGQACHLDLKAIASTVDAEYTEVQDPAPEEGGDA